MSNIEHISEPFKNRIGTDESGKGDFFGPLVVAGFYIDSQDVEQGLFDLGIRDSKRLSAKKIRLKAERIRTLWPNNFEILSPTVEQYNSLYSTIGNLNRLLGWMHGRVLANMADSHFSGMKIPAIVDKFADVSNVITSVGGLDRLDISAITHGEDAEIAIAAASILARDRYVSLMESMNKQFEMEFPLGASQKVKSVGTEFISLFGRERLVEVAKVHFKTAREI